MKFIDYFSPEKEIIKEKFNTIPYMDVWISSIVEGYIYEKAEDPSPSAPNPKGVRGSSIDKIYKGYREEYTERYGKKEGEYKEWYRGEDEHLYKNEQLSRQCYYKEGKLDGEYKDWWSNGQLACQKYYKEGKLDGESKWWNREGYLMELMICENNNIIFHKYYF